MHEFATVIAAAPLYAALIPFALLNAADGWTTYHVLKSGGYEVMPVLARLMARFGVYPVLVVFKVAPVLAVWWLARYGFNGTDLTWKTVAGIDALYGAAVINNYLALRRQQRRKY